MFETRLSRVLLPARGLDAHQALLLIMLMSFEALKFEGKICRL